MVILTIAAAYLLTGLILWLIFMVQGYQNTKWEPEDDFDTKMGYTLLVASFSFGNWVFKWPKYAHILIS